MVVFNRIYDLMFFDEIIKIEAHESEVLCVEFSPTESGTVNINLINPLTLSLVRVSSPKLLNYPKLQTGCKIEKQTAPQ